MDPGRRTCVASWAARHAVWSMPPGGTGPLARTRAPRPNAAVTVTQKSRRHQRATSRARASPVKPPATNQVQCSCMWVYKHVMERFWSKVRKGEGCWEWTGAMAAGGYGQFRFKGRKELAHRVAYELSTGIEPPRRVFGRKLGYRVVGHRCHNPGCVRPDHLELMSQAANLRLALQLGRHRAPPRRDKLTPRDRRDILELLRKGRRQAELAQLYGVTQPAISWIKNGRSPGGRPTSDKVSYVNSPT